MSRQRLGTAATLLRLAGPYALFVVLRRLVPIETLTRWAWHAPTTSRDRPGERVLVDRIARLSRMAGGSADCLPRSLLLYRELSKRQANPQLVIGFSNDRRPLVGHAWVVVDGEPLGETAQTLDSMTSVCAFGARGRMIDAR